YPWLLKGMDGTVLQLTSANLTTNYWFRSDGIMPHIEGVQFLGMGIGTLGSGAISGKQITGWAHNGPSGDLKVDADFYGFSGYGFLSFDAFNADLRIYAAHCNIGVGMGYKSDSWRGTIVSRFGNTALEIGVKMTSDFTNSSHPTLSGYGNCSGDNLIIGGEGNTNAFVIVGGGANSLILHGYCEGPYYDNHAPFLQVGHTDQGPGDTTACTITLDNVSIHSWASTTNMIDVWEPAYIKLEGCDFEPAAPWSLACGQGGTTAWGIILDRALLGWTTNYTLAKSQGILETPSSSLLFTTNDGRYTMASANQIPFFQHYSHVGVAAALGQYSGFTYPLFSAQYWDDLSLQANPRSSMAFSSGGFGTPATLVLSNANLSASNVFVAGITTTNGETNLSWTASTVLMADAGKGSKSIPNTSGILTNNGSGTVGFGLIDTNFFTANAWAWLNSLASSAGLPATGAVTVAWGDKYNTNAFTFSNQGGTFTNSDGNYIQLRDGSLTQSNAATATPPLYTINGQTGIQLQAGGTNFLKATNTLNGITVWATNYYMYSLGHAAPIFDPSQDLWYDLGGFGSLDVQNHHLLDTSGVASLDYQGRQLNSAAGSEVLGWSATGVQLTLGAYSGNGGGLTNLMLTNVLGGIWSYEMTADAIEPSPVGTSMTWLTNTPSGYSTNTLGGGPAFTVWGSSVSASNQVMVRFKLPYDYDGGKINVSLGITGGTNYTGKKAIVSGASFAVVNTALGAFTSVTNNLPVTTSSWQQSLRITGLTIAGTPIPRADCYGLLDIDAGSAGSSFTNNVLVLSASIDGTKTNAIQGSLTLP
ncbi:MAG: hypothetical protein KGL39_39730, partial [Patescibacteria group bacterium]|nr:hypothetical protein [Patescibacteria group bacterium]